MFMTKEELKELIKKEEEIIFFVVKTSPKYCGEVLAECDTLKEAREEVKASKLKTIIIKSTVKIVK